MTDKPGLEALRDTGSLKLPAIAHSPLRFCHPRCRRGSPQGRGVRVSGRGPDDEPRGRPLPRRRSPPHPPRPAGAARRAAGPCDGSPLRQGGRPRHGSYRRFSWNPARCTPPPKKGKVHAGYFLPLQVANPAWNCSSPCCRRCLGCRLQAPTHTHERVTYPTFVLLESSSTYPPQCTTLSTGLLRWS